MFKNYPNTCRSNLFVGSKEINLINLSIEDRRLTQKEIKEQFLSTAGFQIARNYAIKSLFLLLNWDNSNASAKRKFETHLKFAFSLGERDELSVFSFNGVAIAEYKNSHDKNGFQGTMLLHIRGVLFEFDLKQLTLTLVPQESDQKYTFKPFIKIAELRKFFKMDQ